MNALKQNLFKAIDFLIKVESGPDRGKVYRLQPPKITVGRDPRSNICLTDPKVSRQQFIIHFSNNVICEDVSSRKTTLVNGQPCGKTVLRPGDKISFGQSVLKFETRTNEKAQPQIGGGVTSNPLSQEKQKNQKIFRIFLIALIALLGLVFILESPTEEAPSEQLATTADLKSQIEETKERMSLLKEARAQKGNISNSKNFMKSEEHFIIGFRDYQNGRFGRAVKSFGTTIATDPSHTRAHLYSKSARKKKSDLIDTHLRDGRKYRDKLMFNRCAAEFEKAMILINDVNSKKYDLAKSQLEECRLLKTGGYE